MDPRNQTGELGFWEQIQRLRSDLRITDLKRLAWPPILSRALVAFAACFAMVIVIDLVFKEPLNLPRIVLQSSAVGLLILITTTIRNLQPLLVERMEDPIKHKK
jgi:hypothetical protein